MGRRNAMGQSKKHSIALAKQSLSQDPFFASPSSAGPSAGSICCLGKAFLKGRTTRMQSCVLPSEPIRAVMIGPTRTCRLVLLLNSSGNRYSCHCQTWDGREVASWFDSLGFQICKRGTQIGQCVQLSLVGTLLLPCL